MSRKGKGEGGPQSGHSRLMNRNLKKAFRQKEMQRIGVGETRPSGFSTLQPGRKVSATVRVLHYVSTKGCAKLFLIRRQRSAGVVRGLYDSGRELYATATSFEPGGGSNRRVIQEQKSL